MRKSSSFLLLATMALGVAGCTGLDPNPSDDLDLYFVDSADARAMLPQGTAFADGLRTGYFALSDYDKGGGDLDDAMHFTRKAVASAKGLDVQPDALAYRRLAEADSGELGAARARLMAGLDDGGRDKAGKDAARAQVAFDCWLEAVDAKDGPRVAECKAEFEDAMAAVERALVPGPAGVFLVFFAFDRADITPVTERVIDEVAEAYKAGRPARVILAGYADRAGSEAYNLKLSERRARTVAGALEQRGVPAEALEVTWFGEADPRLPTADGIAEPQNRRVQITFETAKP
ncbi:MAG: OmpA family protein [Geminicoccaceae bacterium]